MLVLDFLISLVISLITCTCSVLLCAYVFYFFYGRRQLIFCVHFICWVCAYTVLGSYIPSLVVHGIKLSPTEKLLTDTQQHDLVLIEILVTSLAATSPYDILPRGRWGAVVLPLVLRCLMVRLHPCGYWFLVRNVLSCLLHHRGSHLDGKALDLGLRADIGACSEPAIWEIVGQLREPAEAQLASSVTVLLLPTSVVLIF